MMIDSYVAVDVETTGLNPADDKIIEIGMAKVYKGCIQESFSTLVSPGLVIDERITRLTGITTEMLEGQPVMSDIIGEVIDFIGEAPILGHNIIFDYSFLKKAAVNSGLKFEKQGIDTLKLARRLLPDIPHKNLEYLCEYFNIDAGNSHRAYDDAVSAKRLYEKLWGIKPDDAGFDELIQLNYSAKKDSPITAAQKRYLGVLVQKHNLALDVDVDLLTKSRASRMIDKIILQYGK